MIEKLYSRFLQSQSERIFGVTSHQVQREYPTPEELAAVEIEKARLVREKRESQLPTEYDQADPMQTHLGDFSS